MEEATVRKVGRGGMEEFKHKTQLEIRVEALEIDNNLLWESQWGHSKNLTTIYQLLAEEIAEIGSLLYQHECKDETFKNQLSDTHKKYYEKFEILFKTIKTTSKRKTHKY